MTNGLEDFFSEMLLRIRQDAQDRLDEAALNERISCILKTTRALKEVGIEREEIISLLQKYWVLRRSEAISFIDERPA